MISRTSSGTCKAYSCDECSCRVSEKGPGTFVSEDDPTIITAMIDWQSSSIEPAFWYTDEAPDFATPIAYYSDDTRLEPRAKLVQRPTISA